jgi:hypothetical protein
MRKMTLIGILVIGMAIFFQAGTAVGQCPVSTTAQTPCSTFYVSTWQCPYYCEPGAGFGSLGIGTSNPQAMLHVVGGMRVDSICDVNGQNCKTVSSGWNAANALNSPDGSQTNVVYVNNSANVGVGTTSPQSKFAVNGTITAKEVKVTQTGWSDFVFAEDYRLLPLDKLEAYVNAEKHLPGIPAAKEVEEKGLAIADTLSKQMQKIEELTLYLIQLKKENEELKTRITALEEEK